MSAGSRKGTLIFGLILILVGLAFLISNWYSTLTAWQIMARYWPILLILIGARKLFRYFDWQPPDADRQELPIRKKRKHRPSLFVGLIWMALGFVFLLKNFGIGPDLWPIARRYWPLLLILVGFGKLIDYFRQKEGFSLRFGEVFGILFISIVGMALSRIPQNAVRDLLNTSIQIRDADVILGTTHEYEQDFTFPLAVGIPLRIENSHGSVSVSPGSDGEVRVHLRKKIFEDDEIRARQLADEVKVQGGEEKTGETAVFVVKTNRESLAANSSQIRTDLEVLVPKKLQLDVRNPFGAVTISGLDSNLSLQSSHEPLEVHDCIGTFVIVNNYGDSRLSGLTGNLTVNSHGSVEVDSVKGDVDIRDEYSAVKVSKVEGKLSVVNEEGSITIDSVTKPVVISGRGSSVTASNLEDHLQITNSHRRVRISGVKGNVNLITQYATASLQEIKGDIDISANSGNITIEDAAGSVKMYGPGTYVNVNKAAGFVDINTTLKDVIVNNFSKGCRINAERGDVTLASTSLGSDPIAVKNRFGMITLILPPNSVFQLDASTRNGDIRSDFLGMTPISQPGELTTLNYAKAGGPRIQLATENSDIVIRSREIEQTRHSQSGER
jgi:hypothetical protein